MADARPAATLVRPSLPPLLWFAAAVWAGVMIAEEGVWRGEVVVTAWCYAEVFVALAVVLTLAVGLRERAAALLLVIGLLCGAVAGSLAWATASRLAADLSAAAAQTLRLEVLTDPIDGRFGASSTARVISPGRAGGAKVRVQWPSQGRPPESGELVGVRGSIAPAAADDRRRSDSRAADRRDIPSSLGQSARPVAQCARRVPDRFARGRRRRCARCRDGEATSSRAS